MAAVAGLCPFTSCDDSEDEVTLSSPAVLAIQDADKIAEPVEFYETGAVSTATVDIRAVAKSISDKVLTISFKAAPELVDEYNKSNGTAYKAAPAESYSFENTDVILPRFNEVSSTAKLIFTSEGIPDADTYILPVTFDAVSGDDDVDIDEGMDVYYVFVKKIFLKSVEKLDRSEWSIAYCDSFMEDAVYQGNHYGPAEYMLDGDPLTWWNYLENVTAPPHHVVFDLGKEVWVKSITLTARHHHKEFDLTRCAPRNLEFSFATEIGGDGESALSGDWTESEVFVDLEPWSDRSQFVGTIELSGLYHARYIKMIWNGGYTDGGGIYKGAMLAEFEANGYQDSPYEE